MSLEENKETLILVNENDLEIGSCFKLEAHEKKLLHRAFSIFVYNDKNELLIQQRADCKYHSAGLWANTCCGHPRHGENIKDAAERRLREELGFSTDLEKVYEHQYTADVGKGLVENEYVHIFVGKYSSEFQPNPEEVQNFRWISTDQLKKELTDQPDQFAPWIKIYHQKMDIDFLLY